MKKNLLKKIILSSIIFAGAISSVVGQTEVVKTNLSPQKIANVNGTLYLQPHSVTEDQLWKSDGTNSGTVMVKKLNPGTTSYTFDAPFSFKGNMYFTAGDTYLDKALWKSDGTSAGTDTLIKPFGGNIHDYPPVVINDYFYFIGNSGIITKSDGSVAGTTALTKNSIQVTGTKLTLSNNKIFFTSNQNKELWITDGTDTGTTMVKQIVTDTYSPSGIDRMIDINGIVYFFAANGEYSSANKGSELWRSDGTDAGTYMLKDINPGVNSSGTLNGTLVAMNDNLYFNATDGTHQGLWKSDGTDAGTVLVKDGVSITDKYTITNNKLFFVGNDKHLWVSDGTNAGTLLLNPSKINTLASNNLVSYNGIAYYPAAEDTMQQFKTELWQSDGTPAGTFMVERIGSIGGASGTPSYLTIMDDYLYFAVSKDFALRRLKMGTGGSTKINDINQINFSIYPNPASEFVTLTNLSNNTSVNITDLTGKQVYSTTANATELSINTSGFANGVYLVQTIAGGETANKKLIIQH